MTAQVQAGWLKSFDDPRLPPLADEALLYNADLRIAAARRRDRRGGAQGGRRRAMAGGELLRASQRQGERVRGQLSGLVLSASWELDLWGRVRYGTAAADAQYASAQADQRAARQAIVAALAKAWFLAGESMLQKRLITDVLSASETIVRLAEDRLRFGVGAEADVALARADLQTYRDTPCRSTSRWRNRAARSRCCWAAIRPPRSSCPRG